MGYSSNVNDPMTTMAYVSKDGWCAQTPIPTKYVEGAVKNIGNMQIVIDKTCAEVGYFQAAGTGTMEDPDADFKGHMINFDKYV